MSDSELHDHDCGGDVAAYALGALDPGEATALSRHIETCAVRRGLRESRAARSQGSRSAGAAAASRDWRRPALRLGPALAAAAAAVVLLVAVLGGLSGSPPVRTIHAQVVGPGQAELRLSAGHAELVVSHLPPPPAGKIYELWLAHRHGAPAPTSLFSVTSSGRGDVEVPGDLDGITQLVVTPEPAGGSPRPTHAPIISVAI